MATLQTLAAPNRQSFRCRALVKNLPLNTSLGRNRKVPSFAIPAALHCNREPINECSELGGAGRALSAHKWVIRPRHNRAVFTS